VHLWNGVMLLVCVASEDITFNDAFEQRLFKSRSQVNRESEPCPIVATPSVMLIMLSMVWGLTRMGSVGLGLGSGNSSRNPLRNIYRRSWNGKRRCRLMSLVSTSLAGPSYTKAEAYGMWCEHIRVRGGLGWDPVSFCLPFNFIQFNLFSLSMSI